MSKLFECQLCTRADAHEHSEWGGAEMSVMTSKAEAQRALDAAMKASAEAKAQAAYDSSEQDLLLRVFNDMLGDVTRDGGNKRARGEKPPWWRDDAHMAAIFSHLNKYMHGEKTDPDSGAHTFVHLAWRALAVAYRETYGSRDPKGWWAHD